MGKPQDRQHQHRPRRELRLKGRSLGQQLPRLVEQLRAIGVSISKRQVMRLLIAGQDDFLAEARDVLRAGLQTAGWITMDDTGARHKAGNGFCTQIGNDDFAWFGTTNSKSRLNFRDLLRAGYTDYVVNDAALSYMRNRALAGPVIARLAAHPDKQFADPAAWRTHLARLGITALIVTPDPVQIATEGALWGSIQSHDFLRQGVIVSDDAANSPSAVTRCAGCMPRGWCTSSTRVAFWDYLGSRLAVPDQPTVPRLADLALPRPPSLTICARAFAHVTGTPRNPL